MKHICFVSGRFSRFDLITIERHCKSLVDAGYKVTLLVSDKTPNQCLNGINIVSTNVDCSSAIKSRIKRMWIAYSTLKHHIKNVPADLYHFNDPELIPLANYLKKRRHKVVFHVREPYVFDLKKSLSRLKLPQIFINILIYIFNIYLRKSFDKFDAVFSVSDEKKELKEKFGINKAHLLTNFPIVNKEYVLSKQDYLNRSNTLFYFGVIYDISRQENIFAAMERIPSIDYLLAGVFGDFVYPYEKYIKSLSYWQKVNYVGRFPKTQLPDLFSKATISNVLRDFLDSGTPNGSLGVIKIFESMEAALPVLLPDVPLYRNIVTKYRCGLCVNPNSVDEIENAIRYLVENKELAWELGQNGRKAVLEEFNWGKAVKKLH